MTLCLPHPPTLRDDRGLCYLNLEVPENFRAAVNRHHRHLLQLATSLEAARLPKTEIKRHVDRMVESYRDQLLAALEQYVGDEDA